MFTGIVEAIGSVSALEQHDESSSGGGGTSLTINRADEILADAHLGDSISINGTCLTITEFDESSFKVGVSPETLRRTNLGSLHRHSRVNLERAVLASTRMGGHFVQGHVDTIASILSVTPDGNALTFRLQPRDSHVLRYVVEKGYITLDGASLTVTRVQDGSDGWWEVMLIAYTQERVVMATKRPGDDVNVEVDMLGKYVVDKSVQPYLRQPESERSTSATGSKSTQRTALVQRNTKETKVQVALSLDGGALDLLPDDDNVFSESAVPDQKSQHHASQSSASQQIWVWTGIGFLDHMLHALAKHAGWSLRVRTLGDLAIDDHHTAEDTFLGLGEAFSQALGDRKGLRRFGHAYAPLDEALARAVIDISSRPYFVGEFGFKDAKIGQLTTQMIPHCLQSFSQTAGVTLHVDVLKGLNDHHRAEAAFKALAVAARMAIERVVGSEGEVISTKGVL